MISGVPVPLAVAVIARRRRGCGDLGEIASADFRLRPAGYGGQAARLAMTANESIRRHRAVANSPPSALFPGLAILLRLARQLGRLDRHPRLGEGGAKF